MKNNFAVIKLSDFDRTDTIILGYAGFAEQRTKFETEIKILEIYKLYQMRFQWLYKICW